MATRRVSSFNNKQKSAAGDSTKDGSYNSSGNNSGTVPKKAKPAGKVVKSRYMQAVEKKPLAKTSGPEQPGCAAQRPATPTKPGNPCRSSPSSAPRRSLAPQPLVTPSSMMSSILEPSHAGISNLQSTLLDGHCLRPQFDVSCITEKTMQHNPSDPEEEKEILENNTFLLAYLTAKIESSTRRLREEAEQCLLGAMEEKDRLQEAVGSKKRRHLLQEKEQQLGALLDLQVAALMPAVAAAQGFQQDYATFATALDTTRHELPVKNVHIEGDRREFLGKVEACLRESQSLLQVCCTQDALGADGRAAELLSEVKTTVQEVDKELARGFGEVLELSSTVSRLTVQTQHRQEEEEVGLAGAEELYFLKK